MTPIWDKRRELFRKYQFNDIICVSNFYALSFVILQYNCCVQGIVMLINKKNCILIFIKKKLYSKKLYSNLSSIKLEYFTLIKH